MSLSTPQQIQQQLEQGTLSFEDAVTILQQTYWNSPSTINDGLAVIKYMLALRLNEYEAAAGDKIRLTRRWDKRLAIQSRLAKGSSADIRKAIAFATAAEQDELYETLTEVEATFAAIQAAHRTLETIVGVGQSILKSQGRG